MRDKKRFLERLESYKNALNSLNIAINSKKNEKFSQVNDTIFIDGIIHRYEFTFELAWKTMKDYLEYMGLEERLGTPREVIQHAFKADIIDNGQIWINMMISRNELSHLYDEESSRKIYGKIEKEYLVEFEKLKDVLQKV